jgi:riboflavin transporter FmnP
LKKAQKCFTLEFKLNTKKLAATAVFAALTVALNLSPIKFPAPYLPFLYYQVWEIPIVVAFLLFGPITGFSVLIINTAALFALFPGALPTGPIYNLIAVLSMLTGIYCAQWLTKSLDKKQKEVFLIVTVTFLGVVLRVVVMSFVNWELIKYPPPVGFSMPEEVVVAILPFVAFFNATLAAYTVPAGYFLAKTISHGIKTPLWSP